MATSAPLPQEGAVVRFKCLERVKPVGILGKVKFIANRNWRGRKVNTFTNRQWIFHRRLSIKWQHSRRDSFLFTRNNWCNGLNCYLAFTIVHNLLNHREPLKATHFLFTYCFVAHNISFSQLIYLCWPYFFFLIGNWYGGQSFVSLWPHSTDIVSRVYLNGRVLT